MDKESQLVQCNMTRDWVQADPKRLEQVTIMFQSAKELTLLTTQIADLNQSIRYCLLDISNEIGNYGQISSPDIYEVKAQDVRTSMYLTFCELLHYMSNMESAYRKITKLAGEDPYCWLLFGDLQKITKTKMLFLELFIKITREIEEYLEVSSNLGNRAWTPAHVEALIQLSKTYLRPIDTMTSISLDFRQLADDYQKVIEAQSPA